MITRFTLGTLTHIIVLRSLLHVRRTLGNKISNTSWFQAISGMFLGNNSTHCNFGSARSGSNTIKKIYLKKLHILRSTLDLTLQFL